MIGRINAPHGNRYRKVGLHREMGLGIALALLLAGSGGPGNVPSVPEDSPVDSPSVPVEPPCVDGTFKASQSSATKHFWSWGTTRGVPGIKGGRSVGWTNYPFSLPASDRPGNWVIGGCPASPRFSRSASPASASPASVSLSPTRWPTTGTNRWWATGIDGG